MKRLRRGHTTVEVDERGIPRDATGHRTDRPASYDHKGRRLWRADEMAYALGERVRAIQPNSRFPKYQRMAQGETGTILQVPEFVLREYIVLPDRLFKKFRKTRSGLYLVRMPEHFLEPE